MIIGISGKKQSGKDTVGKIIQYLIWNKSVITEEEFIIYEDMGQPSYNAKVQSGWEIKKFADKIKDIVCLLINCTREQLEDETFKNTELGEEWRIWYGQNYKLASNNNNGRVTKLFNSKAEAEAEVYVYSQKTLVTNIQTEILTPRKLMQLIGTECGRNIIHPNIWVNSVMSGYKQNIINSNFVGKEANYKGNSRLHPNWIITDLRFPNELKAIKDKDGITIRINRPCEECSVLEGHKMYVHKNPPSTHLSETALDNSEFDYAISNDGSIDELIKAVKQVLVTAKLLN